MNRTTKIRKLQLEFTKNELRYTQVKRNKLVVMYAVHGQVTDAVTHYEVLKIIQNPDTKFRDKILPAWESLPGNEQFGKEGSLAFPDLDQSNRYFDTLTERLNKAV